MRNKNEPGSFRDPAGFLFRYKGKLYRQINNIAKNDFDKLISSGLYKKLVNDRLLVSFQEESKSKAQTTEAYKIIKPEMIPFISYPYEWSFTQLKDAAILTLNIQKLALNYGMSLKDASAYNVQFIGSRPIFIDALSFEKYKKGSPWVAYRQLCQHFLAPLTLCSYKDTRLSQLLRVFIDGIPLDLAGKLLPKKTLLNLPILMHIHLHARSQSYFADNRVSFKKKFNLPKFSQKALIYNLKSLLLSLRLKKQKSEWANYYKSTNYISQAFEMKKRIVSMYTAKIKPKTVWDFGANTGEFSKLSAKLGAYTVAWDIDHAAVEKHYLFLKKSDCSNILPLVVDLTNPSPNMGWHLDERLSLFNRGPVDVVLALAIIHHLNISNNIPLSLIASFFASSASSAVVEFIPKNDTQVKRLLKNRKDIFFSYTQKNFEKEMMKYFSLIKKTKIKNSTRTLYLFKKK